jgi:hypothetical protein
MVVRGEDLRLVGGRFKRPDELGRRSLPTGHTYRPPRATGRPGPACLETTFAQG